MDQDLDFDRVVAGLLRKGMGTRVVPQIQVALDTLIGQWGPEVDIRLDDLLVQLLRVGHDQAASALLTEVGAFVRSQEGGRAEAALVQQWIQEGRLPATGGHAEARRAVLRMCLQSSPVIALGRESVGMDERVIEYPWLFERLEAVHPRGERVLDAGSVMNHPEMLREWEHRALGPLSIVTLAYEGRAMPSDLIRYEYADLRKLPYRDDWFNSAFCISTLEHVGMDVSVYGSETQREREPSHAVVDAISELGRVIAPGGTLLLSVPVGRPSDRRWFRVVGVEEVASWTTLPGWSLVDQRYYLHGEEGWARVDAGSVSSAGYNEWREGGMRTAPRKVAAAEAVVLLELRKGEE